MVRICCNNLKRSNDRSLAAFHVLQPYGIKNVRQSQRDHASGDYKGQCLQVLSYKPEHRDGIADEEGGSRCNDKRISRDRKRMVFPYQHLSENAVQAIGKACNQPDDESHDRLLARIPLRNPHDQGAAGKR